MWRAWAIDAHTIAWIGMLTWFAVWEGIALSHHEYLDTFTAHLRPIFISWPITWWMAIGLYVWMGVHLLVPSLETWLAELVRAGVTE